MLLKKYFSLILLLIPFTAFCQTADTDAYKAAFPVVSFQANSRSFTDATAKNLTEIANEIKMHPSDRIVIAGSAGGTKYDEQLAWEHIDAVIVYMSEQQQIPRNSFIIKLDGGSLANTVNLHIASANESGPSSVPEPHPGIFHDEASRTRR